MVTVRIGDSERSLESADESWINQQINRRRNDGQNPCVRVTIHQNCLDMILSTPSCAEGGGGRLPNEKEKEIFGLWEHLHLRMANFTGGNLVAFLKQLRRFLN